MKLWMRRPSRPVNQNSRSGRQSMVPAVAVVNDVRNVRLPVDGSMRTISASRFVLSQLAKAPLDTPRAAA